MAIFRPITAPQVIKPGIAVLLTTAAAAPPPAPRVAAVPQPAPWPHAQAAQLSLRPPASQWGIPDADLIFDRLQPAIVPQRPWPHTSAMPSPKSAATVPAPSAQLASSQRMPVMAAGWPYPQAEQARLAPEPAVFGGVAQIYLEPPPVVTVPPQPWPAASVAQPRALQPIAGVQAPVLPPPAPLIVQPAPWPYVATMLPEPTASVWGIAAVFVVPPELQLPSMPSWPYAGVAARGAQSLPDAAVQTPAPSALLPPLAAPWGYVLAMRQVQAPPAAPAADVPPKVAAVPGPNPWPHAAFARLRDPAPLAGVPATMLLVACPQQTYYASWPYALTQIPVFQTVGGVEVTPTWPAGGRHRIGSTPLADNSPRIGSTPLARPTRRIG